VKNYQRRVICQRDTQKKYLSGSNGLTSIKGIGATPDAARMQRVVSFYEKLPRGAAPEVKPSGLLGRYQARYFGKNQSAARRFPHTRPSDADMIGLMLMEPGSAIVHVIGALMLLGYANNYYFHLRKRSTG